MTRPRSTRPAARRLRPTTGHAGVAAAGGAAPVMPERRAAPALLAGCAGPTLLAGCAALMLLAGCAGPAPQGAEPRANDSRATACRQDAERTVLYRDRGQTMRSDDQDARVGLQSYLGIRSTTDRLAATFERDRLADACVRSADPVEPDPRRRSGG